MAGGQRIMPIEKSSALRKRQEKVDRRILEPVYSTKLGRCYNCAIEQFLSNAQASRLKARVNLIFTSPPFPLASPKKYGNLGGEEYLNWLVNLMCQMRELIADDGSLVVEMGNAWDKGSPTMSTLPLRTLLSIADRADLHVCQQFIWENSARLPGPATWVNKERIRLKDSHTHIWWFAPSKRPKANNRNVLSEYSNAMKRLISTGKYNSGVRPSEHVIGESTFRANNQGAIPGSTLIMGNTHTDAAYRDWCKAKGVSLHPARMPIKIAEFFIKFLTDQNDLVLDPFGGSNTTGRAAEDLSRRWISIERDLDYVKGSQGRFEES